MKASKKEEGRKGTPADKRKSEGTTGGSDDDGLEAGRYQNKLAQDTMCPFQQSVPQTLKARTPCMYRPMQVSPSLHCLQCANKRYLSGASEPCVISCVIR